MLPSQADSALAGAGAISPPRVVTVSATAQAPTSHRRGRVMPTWSPDDQIVQADATRHPRPAGTAPRIDRPASSARGLIASIDHRAVPQLDDGMGDVEEHRIVRRDDGRHAFGLDDRPQELHDRPTRGGVELAGRLVGQQQARAG